MDKLKPCPFCGGIAHSVSAPHVNGDMVGCKSCGASGQIVVYGGDIDGDYTNKYYMQARALWNTRHTVDVEELARAFHETYERLAPDFGYKTRGESAVPWDVVPERNKNLMRAVCKAMASKLQPLNL